MSLKQMLDAVPPLWAAIIAIGGAAAAGWGGALAWDTWSDSDTEQIAAIERRLVSYEESSTEAVAALEVRLALSEQTLCLPDAIEVAGPERLRYCNVVAYVRENGLPMSARPSPASRPTRTPRP